MVFMTQYFMIFLSHLPRIYIKLNIALWGSWLSRCAVSRKVAGSNPDGVIEFFYWFNPSGRTVALVSTQPRSKGGWCVGLTTLLPLCDECL